MSNINERLRPQDMIEDEIYYLETDYKYLIRFHKLGNGNIYGKSLVNILFPFFRKSYSNPIGIHTLIRKANQEEIYWLITCEKDNKFVEKEKLQTRFVLPERWCLRVTQENLSFINKVRDRTCESGTFLISYLLDINIDNSWSCNQNALNEGYTEITFEQFKEHVLKKSITNEQEPINELTYEQKEALLDEAKAKYPKGTVYKGWSENLYQVGNNIHITELGIKDGTNCHLYYFEAQKWVEIISKPEQNENDIFQPGYVVVCENPDSMFYGECFLVNCDSGNRLSLCNGKDILSISNKFKSEFRLANNSEKESFFCNFDYYKRQIISNQPQKSVSSNIQSVLDINLKSSKSKKINNNIPIIKSI
jgi:hypothetical protein